MTKNHVFGNGNLATMFLKFALSGDESLVSQLQLYPSVKRLPWTGGCLGFRVGEDIETKIGIPAPTANEYRQSTSQDDNHCHLALPRSQ